jgi:hypothetical protein
MRGRLERDDLVGRCLAIGPCTRAVLRESQCQGSRQPHEVHKEVDRLGGVLQIRRLLRHLWPAITRAARPIVRATLLDGLTGSCCWIPILMSSYLRLFGFSVGDRVASRSKGVSPSCSLCFARQGILASIARSPSLSAPSHSIRMVASRSRVTYADRRMVTPPRARGGGGEGSGGRADARDKNSCETSSNPRPSGLSGVSAEPSVSF